MRSTLFLLFTISSFGQDRVGSTGFLQVEADSFKELRPKQKELAYWLTQASIAIHPIIFDQLSSWGLRQKAILELIVAHPNGVKPEAAKKIADFTKLFWTNRGNHNDYTAQKFLPDFTFDELKEAALAVVAQSAVPFTAASIVKELDDLKPSLFDPNFEPMITAKSPKPGQDILQASSNNFYLNVTMADLQNFKELYPLNSRIAKVNGKLEEQVYRAGN